MKQIKKTETVAEFQARGGVKLYELITECEQAGVWDGFVRNGYVINKQRLTMSHLSANPDVQTQLYLQQQAGVMVIDKKI